MPQKITKEDINNWLLQDGKGITLVGEYVNSKTPTTFECSHGHQWSTPFGNINRTKRGSECPICSNAKSLTKPTTEEFKEWLLKDGRGIILLDEYQGAMVKIKFQCKHGHQWLSEPTGIKRGCGCPTCAGKIKPSTEEFKEWLLKDGRGIILLEEYIGSASKTLFQCEKGHQWHALPAFIKRGHGCPKCAKHGFNPSMPAVVYGWTRDNYLKVGITNDLVRRLAEHRLHGELTLVYERHYPIGHDALDFERRFKQTHGGNYVSREECPDGWTETFPLSLLSALCDAN
jgi:hypothetical protein